MFPGMSTIKSVEQATLVMAKTIWPEGFTVRPRLGYECAWLVHLTVPTSIWPAHLGNISWNEQENDFEFTLVDGARESSYSDDPVTAIKQAVEAELNRLPVFTAAKVLNLVAKV